MNGNKTAMQAWTSGNVNVNAEMMRDGQETATRAAVSIGNAYIAPKTVGFMF
jgi:hypothetical protein